VSDIIPAGKKKLPEFTPTPGDVPAQDMPVAA